MLYDARSRPWTSASKHVRSRNIRVPDPPGWGPDQERNNPFRRWTQQLLVWGIQASDMDPAQQVACIVPKLPGGAAELAYNLSFQELTQGDMVAGQHVDPLTYLLANLAQLYAPLGEEQRMMAMSELFHFKRNHNENIDQLIARYRLLRLKAAQGQVGLTMSWEGYSWMLLRATGVSSAQLLQLLQPTGNRYPTTEAEFEAMCLAIRRMGHIIESAPHNIAQHLRAPV